LPGTGWFACWRITGRSARGRSPAARPAGGRVARWRRRSRRGRGGERSGPAWVPRRGLARASRRRPRVSARGAGGFGARHPRGCREARAKPRSCGRGSRNRGVRHLGVAAGGPCGHRPRLASTRPVRHVAPGARAACRALAYGGRRTTSGRRSCAEGFRVERAREAARAFRCRRDLAEPPCPAVWSAAAELQVAAARCGAGSAAGGGTRRREASERGGRTGRMAGRVRRAPGPAARGARAWIRRG